MAPPYPAWSSPPLDERGRQSPAGAAWRLDRSVFRSQPTRNLDGLDVWKCMRGDGGSHFSSHAAFISTAPIPSALRQPILRITVNSLPPVSPKLVYVSFFFSFLFFPSSRLVAAVSSPLITRLLVKFVSDRSPASLFGIGARDSSVT